MIGKKINQLATELAPTTTDLTIIGDPISGVSKKITLEQLGAIFGGAVSFYTTLGDFPATGVIDIIYCAKDTKKLYLWSGSAYVEVFPSQALLDTYQLRSEKGNANGYASLDSSGKVPISQLPSSIMEYKGTWNAATNTPTLANGTGDTGDVYICNVAGTVNFGAGPITFAVGDYVIYSGSIWQRSSGAVGTVTSVAASITGDAIGITGSPVTTSGTLAFAFGGNSTQYINGAGNLVTFPGVINEAQNLITEVYNKTGATLTKGTVVYINGGQGNLPTVTKALATGDSTSAQTYGIVRNNITNNNNGYVVVAGRISDLDTQAYTEGTQLYLSPTTAGTFTSTKPYAPNHLVYVGIVVRAHPTQGVIEVKIQNGYEMDELHNVAAQSPDNNDILQYKTATSLWTKVAGTTSNIAEGSNLYYTDARSRAALSFTAGSGAYNSTTGVITIPTNTNQLTNGAAFITLASLSAGAGISYNNTTGVIASTITQYTDALARASISLTTTGTSGAATYNSTTGVLNVPQYAPDLSGYVPTSRTLTINGTAFDLSANRSWSVGTVTSVGLSSATSGVTIGSTPITSSGTITLAIATASGSQQGLLSSTDWTTFNNKQSALTNPVTGTGTTNYLPKFTGTSTIGNSLVQDNGSVVSINRSAGYAIFTVKQSLSTYYQGITVEASSNDSQLQISHTGTLAVVNATYQSTAGYSPLAFYTSDVERMHLTTSGNLGLGVTPSAWAGGTEGALQVGAASIYKYSTYESGYSVNAYYNAGWKYINTDVASQYKQTGGSHIWYSAVGGTAGNAITFTPAMTLNASGNLSVGNTNDIFKLDVYGQARIYQPATNSVNYLNIFNNRSRNAAVLTETTNGGFYAGTSIGTDTFCYQIYDGNAGSARLTIASTGAATFSSSVTASYYDGAIFRVFTSSTFRGGVGTGSWAFGDGSTDTALYSEAAMKIGAGGSQKMIITSSGNVGIGTTSPSGILHVVKSAADVYIESNGGTGNTSRLILKNTAREWRTGADTDGSFWHYDATAGSYRFLINSSGNVGIGTSSPQFAGGGGLHINTSGTDTRLHLTNTTTGVTGTDGFELALVGNDIYYDSKESSGTHIFYTAGSERMRITSGGNVEINTGSIKTGAPTDGTAQTWKLGEDTNTLYTATRTIRVEIAGSVYFLLAVKSSDL
jgi:hypothetical protein